MMPKSCKIALNNSFDSLRYFKLQLTLNSNTFGINFESIEKKEKNNMDSSS